MSDLKQYQDAIAGIESRGQPNNGYGARGPVANASGDRALGKYQVMASNVGPWSKEILGHEITPQEFIDNPDLQDQIFNGKFGQYVSKYGPEGAARAWFAGEQGMNSNSADVNGMTPSRYAAMFSGNAPTGATPTVPASPEQTEPSGPSIWSMLSQGSNTDAETPTGSTPAQSIWDLLGQGGKRMAASVPQLVETDPAPVAPMQAPQAHRGQAVSLIDSIFAPRKRVSLRG